MSRYAVIDGSGHVVNVIIWEGKPWVPPEGCYVSTDATFDIGDTYDFDNDIFIPADRTAPDPIEE